ncbi:hypothetical protein PINS_up013597 [Pythium insidiosum]|nr:hypothetical protein PINS_up013597 [Pythium insidiosum]
MHAIKLWTTALAAIALSIGMGASDAAQSVALATKTTKPGNDSMSVGDGTFVKSQTNTTTFLGTEYNPNKCVLQFGSLKCDKDDCGQLNGYDLECKTLGTENGKPKKSCVCKSVDAAVCQNSTNAAIGGVPQFGDCSGGKQCVDSFGHVPSRLELRICAEKLHCVKEISASAKPAEICHTCRSCIAQNDNTIDGQNNSKLADVRRFDCRKICPKEILDSIEKRNKKGVGIADELSSASASASASGSGSTSASGSGTKKGGKAGSKATTDSDGKKKGSSATTLSVPTLVSAVVISALSAVVLL